MICEAGGCLRQIAPAVESGHRPEMTTPAATDDPELQLLVDGRSIGPARRERTTYLFEVPAGASEILIVSRSVVPALAYPDQSDERRLGISVISIAFRSPHLDVLLKANDPALTQGFHGAEPGHRWTDGRALLPPELVQSFPEGCALELRVSEAALRYPIADGEPGKDP